MIAFMKSACNSIVVLIPAYNPTSRLIEVVEGIKGQRTYPFLIVDDGSDENSRAIFETLERMAEVTVLRHAVNLGKGAALKTGFNYVLLNHRDAEGVLTVDADGQHHPSDAIRVQEMFESSHRQSLVLGSRSFTGTVPLRSRLGNIITKYVLFLFSGLFLEDTQTGLRAIPFSLLRQYLSISANRYEFELEALLLARRMGVKIETLGIKTIYENNNASSHFNPILDSLRIYFVFLRFSISSFLSAALDFSVFSLTYLISQNILVSVLTARLLSATVNFIIGKNFVFKSEEDFEREALFYTLLAITLLCLNFLFIKILNDFFGINVYVAKIISEVSLFAVSFSIQNSFIFVKRKKD